MTVLRFYKLDPLSTQLLVCRSILTVSATGDISMLEDVATDAAEIIPLVKNKVG